MVRGAVEWYANGLGTCKAVEGATSEYKESEDQIAQFVAERCDTGNGEEKAAALFKCYCEWAEGRKEYVMKQTRFGTRLSDLGFAKRTSNGTWYQGIKLRHGFAATAT